MSEKDATSGRPQVLESFEGTRVPAYWGAVGGGKLCLSDKHYKHGRQSLSWTWAEGSRLVCDNPPLDVKKHPEAGLQGWVYNEHPLEGFLTFNLGSASELATDELAYSFRFRLNFTGWRAFWVHLELDARNTPQTEEADAAIEVMEVIPPATIEAGQVYLDMIEFVENMSRLRSADYQIPEHAGGLGEYWQHWPLHYIKQQPSQPLPSSIVEQEKLDFATIRRRYEKWLFGENPDSSNPMLGVAHRQMQKYIRLGHEEFEGLHLKTNDSGSITGPGLFMGRGPNSFHHIFYDIMLPLAFDYRLNGNVSSRDAVFLLFDYVHDQGWAEGSSNGSQILNCLLFAAYCHTLVLMHDELKASGRLEAGVSAALWYLSFGKSFNQFDARFIETNADELRSTVFTSLAMILAMEDSPVKVQYMKDWLDWFNHSLKISPRFAGLIKPDGIGYHHMSIYASCYTTDAYEFCALIVYLLHDTVFAAACASVDNLAHALRTQVVISNKFDAPLATQGRMPGHRSYGVLAAYAFLALAKEPIDHEMAGYFMRYWNQGYNYLRPTLSFDLDGLGGKFLCNQTFGRLQLMQELADLKSQPARPPQGFWMKPYGALAIHRRNDWMVSVKGWSQYVWDFEGHMKTWAAVEENVFARYISYGFLQVLAKGNPIDHVKNGYDISNGWDWSRLPGTTTKYLTLPELYSPTETYATRMFTDETFVGGVSSEGNNGMFSMKLHDIYIDTSFRAIKSYFFFDNKIICLGSNIENEDAEHSTETTLFQCRIADRIMPVWINGEWIAAFPYSHKSDPSKPLTLIDPYGNGYIIPNGGNVRLVRTEQLSRDAWNRRDTKGDYCTCWIDHGKAPKDADYEYVVMVHLGSNEAAALVKEPNYSVLQKDRHAHILHYTPENTTAYAIFDIDHELPQGILKRTSAPVIAMLKEAGDRIVLSVADPDLRLPKRSSLGGLDREAVETASVMQTVQTVLEGEWQIERAGNGVSVKAYSGGETVISFDCIDGKTLEVELRKHV